MNQAVVAGLIRCVAFLYAMVGQAGGTAFLAIMALADFSSMELQPTALLLNIVAAGYTTRGFSSTGSSSGSCYCP